MNCHCVSLPEEDGPKYWPDLLISPVLAENVGRIHVTCDVIESNDLGSYGLSDVSEAWPGQAFGTISFLA